jgi:hypothetical protein
MEHFNDAATVGLENGPTGTIDYSGGVESSGIMLTAAWKSIRTPRILNIRESVEMSNGGEVWR